MLNTAINTLFKFKNLPCLVVTLNGNIANVFTGNGCSIILIAVNGVIVAAGGGKHDQGQEKREQTDDSHRVVLQ